MNNPWADVKPVPPRVAEIELGFLLLDVVSDRENDAQTYAEKVNRIINGIYLAGWQDASRQAYRDELAKPE